MIEIEINYKHVVAHLDDMAKQQIPFALSKALNATVAQPKGAASGLMPTVQGAERLQLRKAFELRQPLWADRSIKVTHFANKREPWATIGIHPQGGDERSDIFGKFETDREKRPKEGRTIAVPVSPKLKRNNKGIISKRDRPRAYEFRQVGKSIRGERGTFIVRQADGSGLILQRTRQGVFALYRLVTRVEIEPDLQWYATAFGTVERVWQPNMLKALDEALRTAK